MKQFWIPIFSISIYCSVCFGSDDTAIFNLEGLTSLEISIITTDVLIFEGELSSTYSEILLPSRITVPGSNHVQNGVSPGNLSISKVLFMSETSLNDARIIEYLNEKRGFELPVAIPFKKTSEGIFFLNHEVQRRKGIFLVTFDPTLLKYRLISSHGFAESDEILKAICLKIERIREWCEYIESLQNE